MKYFIAGVLAGLFILTPLGAFVYVKLGLLSLETTAKPFPLEETLAHTALHADIGSARNVPDPLPVSDENLLAGAKAYREQCAVCHGLPGQDKTPIAAGMFPKPPQLLQGKGVTDDAEGGTYWKITNGIRLSGMPRFDGLTETARWQMTMVLKHADQLPAAAQTELRTPLTFR